MATHKFTLTIDEATGAVAATHRCTVEVAGQSVSHARDVEMPADVAAAMKQFIDTNRATVEAEAGALAVSHAAALAGKKQPGVTPLKVGGSLGPVSQAQIDKKE